MNLIKSFFLIALFCSQLAACTVSEKNTGKTSPAKFSSQAEVPGPRCTIYKTRNDYRAHVPVTLSEDKSVIVSFPDIRDVKTKEGFSLPDILAGGYLLDNRGISPGVAFLSYTYETFAALQKTPSAVDLYREIIDKDPVTEMYDCGLRSSYSDIVKELNDIILSGDLRRFKRLK